jgi:hypothetical protein
MANNNAMLANTAGTKQARIKVIQSDPEVPLEILAEAVLDVAKAAKAIMNGPLTRRAVILLIHDKCAGRVSKTAIEAVLDGAEGLHQYVRLRKV